MSRGVEREQTEVCDPNLTVTESISIVPGTPGEHLLYAEFLIQTTRSCEKKMLFRMIRRIPSRPHFNIHLRDTLFILPFL